MVALVTNVVLALTDAAALRALRWGPGRALILFLLGPLALVLGAPLLGWRTFALLQVMAWAIFVHGPLVLVGVAVRTRSWASALLAAAIALVGVDAFFVEPRRLEVNTVPVPGPPLTIAVVADLQTDAVGDHERRALDAVAAAEPDLVLFAGDYLQIRDDADYAREAAELNALLRGVSGRLGAYAVRGDVEREEWPALFEGTGITAVTRSQTFDLGPVTVTALSPEDVRRMTSPALRKPGWRSPVPRRDGFHVVLAHRPDYALGKPEADLLVAGHVHGGQVRLPWIGGLTPLMTLSAVPRAWAAGTTGLPWGGHLVVSRGIGMERNDAPRLRFLCPPEIVIVQVGGG